VAIKVLRNTNNYQAFQQEARIWVDLGSHRNVMQIIEANVYDDYLVIVSLYTAEGSLKSWLKNNNGCAPSEKVAIGLTLEILEGIAHLHKNKVIHCDLAPKNILLQNGIPQLIDFGVSKVLASNRSTIDGMSGTPSYMAPEVYQYKTSKRSDIWSVGVILYQLVCGKLPFEAENRDELREKICSASVPPFPTNVSKPIQDIIYRALEKDRKNRFQSAEEMIEALKAASLSNSALPPPANPLPPLKNAMDYVVRAIENYKQGKLDQALADFNLAIKFDPKYDYLIRGNVYYKQDKLKQALANYNKAIDLDPNFAAAYNGRGNVYSDQGELDKALVNYSKAIQFAPKFAAAYNGRGNVYYKQDKLKQALADYNKAIQLDTKYAFAYYSRGNVYYKQGKLKEALADYNKAIQLDPKYAFAYYNRGILHKKLNNKTTAIADFQKAKSLYKDPKDIQYTIDQLRSLGVEE
jgi:serine/threonine protein kinase